MARGKVDSWKLKKWFTVNAPKVFNESVIGEMPANNEDSIISRNIITDLFSLTKNPAHMYTNVKLKVYSVKGESAQTKIILIEQIYSYIRSLARRHRTISELVLPITTKDKVSMVVKIIAIANGRIPKTRIIGIRKEMKKILEEPFKETNSTDIINEVIEKKLQATITSKIKNISQINKVEIKKLEIPEGI